MKFARAATFVLTALTRGALGHGTNLRAAPFNDKEADQLESEANEIQAGLRHGLQDGKKGYKQSCDGRKSCKKGLSCDEVYQKCYHFPRRDGEPCIEMDHHSRCHNGLACVEGQCKAGYEMQHNTPLELLPTKGDCPDDVKESCPADAMCFMGEDSGPHCICPGTGKAAVEGVSCQTTGNYYQHFHGDASGDEACDPEESNCGEGAECQIHGFEIVCLCPGDGPVPQNVSCSSIKSHAMMVNTETINLAGTPGNLTRTPTIEDQTGTGGGEEEEMDRRLGECDDPDCCDIKDWQSGEYDLGCYWYERDEPGCPQRGHDFTGDKGPAAQGCCHCGGGIKKKINPFTVIFMADMEVLYRSHRWEFCHRMARFVRTFGQRNVRFTNYPEYKIDPKLVIHGGDISDWNSHWDNISVSKVFHQVFAQFYNAGIPLISILGNHDRRDKISQKYTNSKAASVVEETFRRSKNHGLQYESVNGQHNHNYYVANFRGLQIATVNDLLDLKKTSSSHEASRQRRQWEEFKSKVDKKKPTLFFSHQTFLLSDEEWPQFMGTFPVHGDGLHHHYSGHIHVHQQYDREFKKTGSETEFGRDHFWITQTDAPYIHLKAGSWHRKPGFVAMLVDPTYGVLETKVIEIPPSTYELLTHCRKSGWSVAPWNGSKCCKGTWRWRWWKAVCI